MINERFMFGSVASIALLLGVDILDDLGHGSDGGHVTIELLAFSISAAIIFSGILQLASSWRIQTAQSETALKRMQEQRDQWKEKAKESFKNLSQVIDDQFSLWRLTAAEKEVGLLILKGLSHKEIAVVRNCSERTIRQQATTLYAKAGLSGKGDLSAFFLEDLMLPNARHEDSNLESDS